MGQRTIWAYGPIAALGNQCGFVSCDMELADELLKAGAVEDPRLGAARLTRINGKPVPQEYLTTDMRAGRSRGKPKVNNRPAPSDESEVPESPEPGEDD